MIVTAAPYTRKRDIINSNLHLFHVDDSACDPRAQIDQISVFNPPMIAGETYAVKTCIAHGAWGFIYADNI